MNEEIINNKEAKPKRSRRKIVFGMIAVMMLGCCGLFSLGALLNTPEEQADATANAQEPGGIHTAQTSVAFVEVTEESPATSTSLPTNTPEPTNTPKPTNTPEPTNTPAPTNTPRPTKTPQPTATSTPTPEPIVFSGTGDTIVDLEKWVGPALAFISYSGGRNFVVRNYGADGETIDLLVNTIGRYEGTVPLDFLGGEQTTRFEIKSSGQWEIQVLPFEQIRKVTIPGIFDGIGDDVVFLQGVSKPDLLKIDASQTKSNFVILGYGNTRDLLVNEIAPYSGTVIVSSNLPTSNGALVLVIKADGNWSIEVITR